MTSTLSFLLAAFFSSGAFARFIPLKVVTGDKHTCVLSTEGQIKCWGYNGFRELGTGDNTDHGRDENSMGKSLSTVDLGTIGTDKIAAKDLCSGISATCAVTSQGKVKCWGFNNGNYGALGQGDNAYVSYRTGNELPFTDLGSSFHVKKISCGDYRACALSDSGNVKCWGYNGDGQLGLGDQENRGYSPQTIGDSLPIIMDLTNVRMISTGGGHTCALSERGVRCWGGSYVGQSGLESRLTFGNTPDTIPAKIPYLKLALSENETILALETGISHSCVLIENPRANVQRHIKCWGDHRYGILGIGDGIAHGADPDTMGPKLPAVNIDLDNIVSIHPHFFFTCALNRSGRVKCWGANDNGQLGVGDRRRRGETPADLGANLPFVDLGLPAKALSTGPSSQHSCAILINNEIKCWGLGKYGQLGNESSENIGDLRNQMGENLPFVRFN